MRRTLKTLFSLALALVLVLSMAPAVAASYIAGADTDLDNYKQSITFQNVANGDTLTAYKLVCYDADNNYNSYALANGTDSKDFDAFVTSKKGNYSGDNAAYLESLGVTGIPALINEFAAEVNANTYNLPAAYATGTSSTDNTVTLRLEPGWYLLLGTTTASNSKVYMPSVVYVQLLNGNVSVYAGGASTALTTPYNVAVKRSDAPSADKTVKDSDDTLGYTDTATAGVGDTVSFLLTVTIPQYTDAYSVSLVLTDTLTNLEYVTSSIKMYSDDTLSTEIENGITTTSTSTYSSGTQTLTITLSYTDINPTTGGKTVYITYNATVKSDAAVTNTARNSVVLNYNINGNTDLTTTTSTATVYSYALQVSKTDDSTQTASPLTGAEFKVYTSDQAGADPLKFTLKDGYYYPDASGTVTEIPVDSTGKLLIKGLDEGTYYLEESTVPSGYYAPSGRFKVTLTAATDNSSNATSGLAASSSAGAVKTDDASLISGTVNSTNSNQYDVTIKNSSMANLPSTGGVGTAIFTVGGIALMALAAWLFFSRRKGSAK